MSPLISQGQWVFFFLGLPTQSPKGASSSTPLTPNLVERWCRKFSVKFIELSVSGQVSGTKKIALDHWPQDSRVSGFIELAGSK
jgi:hypothetical protein